MSAKSIVADFRQEVQAMESDLLNIDNIKAWKMVRHGATVILDGFEQLGLDNDPAFTEASSILNMLFEKASVSSDVDRTLHDKVVALTAIADDLNLDGKEMQDLLDRWEVAADKLSAAAEVSKGKGKATPTANLEHAYGNTVDSFTSPTVRGVRKYLTQNFGKGWYEGNAARVTRLSDGKFIDDKGNVQEPFELTGTVTVTAEALPAEDEVAQEVTPEA